MRDREPGPSAGARRGLSVRIRLIAIALLPTVLVLPLLLLLVVGWWASGFDRLLIVKVNGDLTIARQYLERLKERSDETLHALADSTAFARVLEARDAAATRQFLVRRRAELGFDFLHLVGADGRLVVGGGAEDPGGTLPRHPVLAGALAGRAGTEIDIMEAAELARAAPGSEARARIDLVDTPNAVPTDRLAETRGMVILSAVPVRLPDGTPGALAGGRLLNQNLDFIDTMNDLVYKDASLPEGSRGTATLFLDDVRISTNVRLFEGQRALGTRVSAAVRRAVLDEGRIWLDRAFVVNDWYISAYEPIADGSGRRIGMLYVGFLEKPFRLQKMAFVAAVVAAFLVVAALSIPVFLRWARAIFSPIERMDATIEQVEAGDLGARTGHVANRDEIGRLAHHFDGLLDSLQARDRELREWAEELDRRVDLRTRELRAANQRLAETQQQLVMSEKLAAIGEITAGVAHEINNPVAVIQGNLDVAREILGAAADPVGTEFGLIDEQVHRIDLIVGKLLQFARPAEFAESSGAYRPADVITDSLLLVRHSLARAEIEIRRLDLAAGWIAMNRTDLQQVLINLFVNAIHAMPDGGILSIATHDTIWRDGPAVSITVSDTGLGIDPDTLPRIFDAFFTTKARQGTGLGLSISYSLVSQAGGTITATSSPGVGSVFTVQLPADTSTGPT